MQEGSASVVWIRVGVERVVKLVRLSSLRGGQKRREERWLRGAGLYTMGGGRGHGRMPGLGGMAK